MMYAWRGNIVRIVFIGCVESSEMFLKVLINEGAEIVGVITKNKSVQNADFVDLASVAIDKKIPYQYVENINEEQSKDFIKRMKPDIGFCLGWSQLIKKEVLEMFPKGVIGFHPAKLPQNRGRHPLIWALVLGLEQTASTFFRMNEHVDAGDILSQEIVEIDYSDNARSLYDKVMLIACKQVVAVWKEQCNKNVSVIKIENALSNAWRKRNRNDGRIDWRMSSRGIYNLVRGLSKPYVGAHFEYGQAEYKVWKVRECLDKGYENMEPGKILWVKDNHTFAVKAGENIVEVVDYDNFKPIEGMYL